MAVIKTFGKSNIVDTSNYELSDYEAQKNQFLENVKKEANQIMSQARLEAAEILKKSQQEGLDKVKDKVAQIEEDAQEKGYEDGLKKAEKEFSESRDEKIKSEVEPLLRIFEKLPAEFSKVKAELLREAEAELVSSSLSLAKSIVGQHVDVDESLLKARLEKALQVLGRGLSLEIRVNPENLEKAQRIFSTLSEGGQENVLWKGDDNFSSSQVLVSRGKSRVNLGNELQWERLLEELKGKGIELGVDSPTQTES